MSRRHVLGDYYSRCEAIESVPVYLNNTEGEVLGHVDQGLGHYADAFSFHLSPEICKRLSTGYFTYGFDFGYAEAEVVSGQRRRIKLNSIFLVERQNYEKRVPAAILRG